MHRGKVTTQWRHSHRWLHAFIAAVTSVTCWFNHIRKRIQVEEIPDWRRMNFMIHGKFNERTYGINIHTHIHEADTYGQTDRQAQLFDLLSREEKQEHGNSVCVSNMHLEFAFTVACDERAAYSYVQFSLFSLSVACSLTQFSCLFYFTVAGHVL
jgi:hypothetical protein